MTTYFVRSLGYGWLLAACVGLIVAFTFAWWRDGLLAAVEKLSWDGAISPIFVAAVLGPAVALVLCAVWMQRRDDRKWEAIRPPL
jgi:hypothetical protein